MKITNIYSSSAVDKDMLIDLALLLFGIRKRRNILLEDISRDTGMSVEEVDGIEIGSSPIDFDRLKILLDYYAIKLDRSQFEFPNLPYEDFERYFTPVRLS